MSNDKDMDEMADFSEEEMLDSDVTDEEFAEEGEWDEYEDEFGDFEEPAPAGKKFPLSFNMIIIIGAVLVGLGVLYMTMGGAGKDSGQEQSALPPQPAPAQTAAMSSEQLPLPTPVETDAQPPASGGMFDDIASLEGVGDRRSGDAVYDDETSFDGDQALQPLPGDEDTESDPLMPMPVKEPSDALSAGLPKAQDVMIDNAAMESAPKSGQRAIQDAGMGESSADTLGRLMARFDALEKQIDTMQDNMAGKADLAALSKKVSTLEKRLESVRANTAGVGIRAAPVTSSSVPSRAVPQATPRAASVDQWILKSARPGAATLGRKGSEEVIAVAEGDTLQSIGKIVSIKPEEGLWVVQGTRGRITQ